MNIPFEHSVLDSALERMDIADIAQATIRQSGDIARLMEQATGTEFIHLEMGVPGLPPEKVGVEAECEALHRGVASQYPNMYGIEPLKEEASRFIRAFLDIEVSPRGCIPTVGSMQGSFTLFQLCSQLDPKRNTILFIDPGFPVQRSQTRILGIPSVSFDIYDYRAEKLGPKLESSCARATSPPSSTRTPTTRRGFASRRRSCARWASWLRSTTPWSSRIWPTSAWTSASRWDTPSRRPSRRRWPAIRRTTS